jgi:hypothetical protein
MLTDVDNSTERSGKRRHFVVDDEETVGDPGIVKKDKKSKRRKREPEAIMEDLKSDDVAEDGKEKKRKKNRKNITRNEAHDTPKKKKHGNKTGFTDPNEDEVLQDKSRKCLYSPSVQLEMLMMRCAQV